MLWPMIEEEDERAVLEVLRSRVLVDGPQTEALEREFAARVGAKYCVAVNNCTSAIQIALAAHDVGKGTKVAVPAISFSGSLLPISHLGAEPVFCDVEPETGNIDPYRVPDDVDYILPVHLHGHAAGLDLLEEIAPVIEDGCQAYGTSYKGRPIGQKGTVCWSTSPAKTLAAPDGGMITTNNAYIDVISRRLRAFGSSNKNDVEDTRGFNWRMTEVTAAIVRSRLAQLDVLLDSARSIAASLTAGLRNVVTTPEQMPYCTSHGWHKYRVRFPSSRERDEAGKKLTKAGVPWHLWQRRPMSRYTAYRGRFRAEDGEAAWLLSTSLLLGSEEVPLQVWDDELLLRAIDALT